jgi:hypothetical protein
VISCEKIVNWTKYGIVLDTVIQRRNCNKCGYVCVCVRTDRIDIRHRNGTLILVGGVTVLVCVLVGVVFVLLLGRLCGWCLPSSIYEPPPRLLCCYWTHARKYQSSLPP